MRPLLASLTRWLNRRIDARIAAELERRRQVEIAVMTKLARSIAPAPSSPLAERTAEGVWIITGTAEADGHVADRSRDDRWIGA